MEEGNLVTESEGEEGTEAVPKASEEAPTIPQSGHEPRVLIFTKDTTITDEKSASFKRIEGLKDVFQEVHVVVMRDEEDKEAEVSRPFRNVWFYQTESTAWWKLPYMTYKFAEGQMVFGGGFHADVVISEDAHDAGLVGYLLARKYEVPFQLHIYEDFFDEAYLESTAHPTMYGWFSDYLLNRVTSVRTKTDFQREAVLAANRDLTDVETLPHYYNLEAWRDAEPAFDLKEKYPEFNFIMLNISLMKKNSHPTEVLAGAAKILRRYPTLGLVMVGSGPMRAQLEKQAVTLGVQKQVRFEPMPSEIVSHLKTAHVLIHLSEDSEEDEVLLAAASVKLPMVALKAGLAGTLFVDDESAQLCEATDDECVSESINRYLNENIERSSFALKAYELVFEKIVQDYDAYISAYKNSIEKCLVQEDEETVPPTD